MIRCKELNKTFTDKKGLFSALKAAKQELIAAKKAVIKNSDPVLAGMSFISTKKGSTPKEISFGDYVYPVINTINYLDSHKDMHLWGIWDKSAKEQNNKVYYLINHDLSIGKVISYPRDVEIMVKEMSWKDLGFNFSGKTQALIFKAKLTEQSNKDAYDAIKAGESIQNSVRMQYVRMDLAINSNDKDFREEKTVWDKYSPNTVNKEALGEDYFWAVYEAKIYMEGSAVLFGSNESTPVLFTEPKAVNKKMLTALSDVLGLFEKKNLIRTSLAMLMGNGPMMKMVKQLLMPL